MYKGYYFIIKIAFVKLKYKFFKSKKRTSLTDSFYLYSYFRYILNCKKRSL